MRAGRRLGALLIGAAIAVGVTAPQAQAGSNLLGPVVAGPTVLRPDTILDTQPAPIAVAPRGVVLFHATGRSTSIECALDDAGFVPCVSPLVVTALPGAHRLLIRALGPGGPDLTPARIGWTVGVALIPGRLPWLQDLTSPVVSSVAATAPEQMLHVTLMNISTATNGTVAPLVPGQPWYLWAWSHDAPLMRLFTAATSAGPFTEITDRSKFDFSGPPAGWCTCHWSSGDVVWDPQTQYFYSTPHSIQADAHDPGLAKYYGIQSTFIMRSRDGRMWQRMGDTPILDNGIEGSFDDYELAYGRFMRDIDGRLVRTSSGDAVWYYRGTHRPLFCDTATQRCADLDAPENHQAYGLGAATSADMTHWTKASERPIGAPFGDLGIFAIGSAIASGQTVTLTWAIQTTMFQKSSTNPLDFNETALTVAPQPAPFLSAAGLTSTPALNAGPGTPIYQHPALLYDGGSLVRDGDTLRMAFGSYGVTHYEINTASTMPFGAGVLKLGL